MYIVEVAMSSSLSGSLMLSQLGTITIIYYVEQRHVNPFASLGSNDMTDILSTSEYLGLAGSYLP